MKQASLFLFLSLSLLGCNLKRAKFLKTQKAAKLKEQFLEFEDFGIRDKPILNREYLTCLSWYVDVYGESYPEKILQILPEEMINPKELQKGDYSDLEYASLGILEDYILNPKYLNYPLIGLKPNQILEIQKWLSDRYNENCLIELGILKFNPNQNDESSFVTESFLTGQYQGIRKTWLIPSWQDDIFLPAFRLPLEEEISTLLEVEPPSTLLQEYPFTKKDFLWRWSYYFLTEYPEKQELILHLVEDLVLTSQSDYPLEKHKLEAALMKKEELFTNAYDVRIQRVKTDFGFVVYDFEEKDRYGQMEFTIIGTNKSGGPIAIEGPLSSRENRSETNKVYYPAYSKILR